MIWHAWGNMSIGLCGGNRIIRHDHHQVIPGQIQLQGTKFISSFKGIYRFVPDKKSTVTAKLPGTDLQRSEEHTSELQSLMRNSYAVFCLKKKKKYFTPQHNKTHNTKHN